MKKIIIIMFLLMLLPLQKIYANDNSLIKNKINEITEDKFVYELGTCLVDDVYVEYRYYQRGEKIEIIDENDKYYYVNYNGLSLAIKKDYIRKDSEEPFEEYHAYTKGGSSLYEDIDLENVKQTFSLNNEVDVIDSFAGLLYVKYGEMEGYMYPSQVSKNKISTYVAPKIETPIESYDYSSGGGDNSGNNDPSPAPSSGDGEDISLKIDKPRIILLAKEGETGYILANNTIAYIAVFNRLDEVKVLYEDKTYSYVLLQGYKAKVENKFIRLNSENSYIEKELYTTSNAIIYSDYKLTNKLKTCLINEIITIVDEIDNIYVVKMKDDTFGYIKKTNTSEEKLKVYVAPKIETPVETYDYSGGGDSGGSDDSGNSSSEPEWTEPAL